MILGKIFGWIFGILFLLAALGSTVTHTYSMSITYIAIGVALLPPGRSMARAVTKITLSGKQRVALIFVLLVLNFSTYMFGPNLISVFSTQNFNFDTYDSSDSAEAALRALLMGKTKKEADSTLLKDAGVVYGGTVTLTDQHMHPTGEVAHTYFRRARSIIPFLPCIWEVRIHYDHKQNIDQLFAHLGCGDWARMYLNGLIERQEK